MAGKVKGTTRRFVLKAAAAAGGGLAIGFGAPAGPGGRARARRAMAQGQAPSFEFAPWLIIRTDEQVIIRIARSELGQGTATGLAQLVAEELDCDWARVSIEMIGPSANAARGRAWGDLVTTNSRGIRASHEYLRLAGATARAMLVGAAADLWKVNARDLRVHNGIVTQPFTRRAASFGRLAPLAAQRTPPHPRLVQLSEPSTWTIVGKSMKPVGLADKISGRAIYGIDLKLPGMLSAAIKDSPVIGAKLEQFDASAVLAMPGVRHVLKVGETGVAVVAETWWQAQKALAALPASWEKGADAGLSTAAIAEVLKEGVESKEGYIGTTHGDALKAIAGSKKVEPAIYHLPYVHHATLEPMCATAQWTPDRCDVWAATQNADTALKAAAEAAGLTPDQVEIHRVLSGGAFGRRARSDYIAQAVQIARQVPGTPVKLLWSREEDMASGYCRPAAQAKLTGGIDEKGEVTALIVHLSGPSIFISSNPKVTRGRDARVFQGLLTEAGDAQIGYSIPNLYIDHAMRNLAVPVGSWRGVYSNQNAIFLECYIDEMAKAAGRDPYDFRRSMMRAHPKHLAVLTAAGEKAGWGRPTAEGVHRGIAQAMAVGSHAAAVAEVSISPSGTVRVHRVVVALDCGQVVNPGQVTAQIEGSVAMGLSTLLHEAITIRDGRIEQSNFTDYRVLRLAEMPVVDALLVPSGTPFGGVGEATIALVAPAVLNAIAAATGKRIRSLPLKDVKLI